MATIFLSPGGWMMTLVTTAKVDHMPVDNQEVPGGLYPMIARAYEMDEYRVMAGWPVASPQVRDQGRDDGVLPLGSTSRTVMTPPPSSPVRCCGGVRTQTCTTRPALEWRTIQNTAGQPVVWKTGVLYATGADQRLHLPGQRRGVHPTRRSTSTPTTGATCGATCHHHHRWLRGLHGDHGDEPQLDLRERHQRALQRDLVSGATYSQTTTSSPRT